MIYFAVMMLVFSYVVAKLASYLFFHPRPADMINYQDSVVGPLSYNGFPSGHALLAGVAAAIVYRFNKRIGLGMWALAWLVGLSRVVVGVHFAVDVIASMVIVGAVNNLVKLRKKEKTEWENILAIIS